MKNITRYILIFVLTSSVSFAQSPQNIRKLEEKYTEYFKLNRETVFLHLNKTTVAPQENIWLAAYAYNPKTGLPNKEIANLEIQVFNEAGKYLDSQTLLVSNGKGAGIVELDEKNFPPGNYHLKASTNYMKNFKEELSFSQHFTILGENKPQHVGQEGYDLQLLPEGGHLVAGILNTVGVKLINSKGNGVFFTNAKILGPDQNVITTFKSNQFGITKFNFNPVLNVEYTVVLTTENGKEITQKIKNPEATGIVMISAERPKEFVFSVQTNAETRPSLNDKPFYLAIHKDGLIKDFAFMFPEEGLQANIAVSKDSLFSGINTITVFNEQLQPILERIVFNGDKLKRSNLSGKMIRKNGDSILIGLNSSPAIQNVSLSISVLPSETNSYNPHHNILSAFYLKPYLQGTIENPSWYFTPGNERRKIYDLDLLLLTQGWSKYSWRDIFHNPPNELFQPEIAFDIEGRVVGRNSKKENSLFIRSEETGLFEIVEIQEDDTFKLENIYLVDSTEISFGLLNDRSDKIKRPVISSRISPFKKQQDLKKPYDFQAGKSFAENKFRPEDFPDTSVSLDTVMLQGIRKTSQKYKNETRVFDEELEITDQIASRYYFITDLIASRGFRVRRTPTGVEIINNIPFSLTEGASPNPLIYFNGAPIGTNTEMLTDLQSSQVESIVINKRGLGYGMNGGNGVIKIITKKGMGRARNSDTIESVVTSNGFSENKRFYAPKYRSYNDGFFKTYGAISWIPYLNLQADGSARFSIMNLLQPEVNIYVEGMNAGGVLFSEVLTIKTQ